MKNENKVRHGDCRRGNIQRLYRIWSNMIQRCKNPNKPDYKWYGAKGIKVCKEWEDYLIFKEWAINNGYEENLTIDRKEGDKDYCPDNCRWITIEDQQSNKKSNHIIEFNGEKHTINEWARILGIRREIIKDRLRLGWSIERTLSEPVKEQRKGISYNGETHSWTEWSKITGIPYKTLINRFYDSHWSIERTLTEIPQKKNKKK